MNIHLKSMILCHRFCAMWKFLWAVLLVSLLWNHLAVAQSQKSWLTDRYIGEARVALAMGKLLLWEKKLQQARSVFINERPKMSIEQRNQSRLWLSLLLSKFYQFQGRQPQIKNISDFEGLDELKSYIQQYEDVLESLQQAHGHLRTYNQLYVRVAQRSDIQAQLQLQSSLSLARDLEGNVRQGQSYVAFLRYVVLNWSKRQTLTKEISQNRKLILQLKQRQRRAEQEREQIRQTQVKLAKIVKEAREQYLQMKLRLQSRERTAQSMLWSGIGVMIAGTVGTVVGIVFFTRAFDLNLSPGEATFSTNVGAGLMGGGGGVFGIGAILTITGAVIRPSTKDKNRIIIESQKKYLKFEQQRQRLFEVE